MHCRQRAHFLLAQRLQAVALLPLLYLPIVQVFALRTRLHVCRTGKVAEVFVYKDFSRAKVDSASAGDIVAMSGAPRQFCKRCVGANARNIIAICWLCLSCASFSWRLVLQMCSPRSTAQAGATTMSSQLLNAAVLASQPQHLCKFGRHQRLPLSFWRSDCHKQFTANAATLESRTKACFAGLSDASIGDTVCAAQTRLPLPTIKVEEPTVRMSFLINTSPFAGRDGKYVTTRNIKDRLNRELERNLALKVRHMSHFCATL